MTRRHTKQAITGKTTGKGKVKQAPKAYTGETVAKEDYKK